MVFREKGPTGEGYLPDADKVLHTFDDELKTKGILNDKGEIIDEEGFIDFVTLEYNKGFLR